MEKANALFCPRSNSIFKHEEQKHFCRTLSPLGLGNRLRAALVTRQRLIKSQRPEVIFSTCLFWISCPVTLQPLGKLGYNTLAQWMFQPQSGVSYKNPSWLQTLIPECYSANLEFVADLLWSLDCEFFSWNSYSSFDLMHELYLLTVWWRSASRNH